MKHQPPRNIDGFGLRRRKAGAESSTASSHEIDTLPVPQQFLEKPVEHSVPIVHKRLAAAAVGQTQTTAANPGLAQEIHDSLSAIDDEKKPYKSKPRIGRKKLIKRVMLLIILACILWAGFIGVKALLASRSVFNGNIFDVFSNKQLKKDQYGRSNILLFGTSEDDPGHEDSGAELTDSIMVISVSQEKKDAVMFSIPRDLWVDYGRACDAGYSGKINAVYECGKQGASEEAGAQTLKGVVSDAFGISIQYYAKVNYSALKDAVNAVGGITVTIDSDDPRGVMDTNFDWQCGATYAQRTATCPPRGHMVDYKNGPANLDGVHALALARARNANHDGSYGLGGGNFDREQYQQKIIIAIKEKAASAGTLANPVAMTGLIDSVGDNVKTNFETAEIRALIDLASSTDRTKIRSLSLVDENSPLVTNGDYGVQSIVRPVEGIDDFSAIKNFVQTQLNTSSSAETSESATIEVLNGTDKSGVASRKEAELESKGLIITSIGDAPSSTSYGKVQWFDMTGGTKPKTAKKLLDVLGEPSSGSSLPAGVYSNAEFVVIVGD